MQVRVHQPRSHSIALDGEGIMPGVDTL